MIRKQTDNILMLISILFFLMFSISFLLMPLGEETSNGKISVYTLVVGLMFWISIIMAIVIQCILSYRMKKRVMIHSTEKEILEQKIGLVSFFKNIYAIVADVIMIVSLIGLIIAMISTQGLGYVCYIFISLLVFFFSMHCILNGKVFCYIINSKPKFLRYETNK